MDTATLNLYYGPLWQADSSGPIHAGTGGHNDAPSLTSQIILMEEKLSQFLWIVNINNHYQSITSLYVQRGDDIWLSFCQ